MKVPLPLRHVNQLILYYDLQTCDNGRPGANYFYVATGLSSFIATLAISALCGWCAEQSRDLEGEYDNTVDSACHVPNFNCRRK
jgi:hypothetical protein